MRNEKRAKVLTISILHKLAELAITTEENEMELLESQIEDKVAQLSEITGTDPNALLEPIRELVEEKHREIDEGTADAVAVALIVSTTQDLTEFEELMSRNRQSARERAADEMGGEVRSGEEPERKVDPDVLAGLSTEVVEN